MLGPFGQITPPPFIGPNGYGDLTAGGLVQFLNNILRLMIMAAGIFALFNLVIAGYGFMSAGGDPKGIENAWNKIWQSLLGLVIVLGSFVLAAIFGYLLFGDPMAILQPKIYGPGTSP